MFAVGQEVYFIIDSTDIIIKKGKVLRSYIYFTKRYWILGEDGFYYTLTPHNVSDSREDLKNIIMENLTKEVEDLKMKEKKLYDQMRLIKETV